MKGGYKTASPKQAKMPGSVQKSPRANDSAYHGGHGKNGAKKGAGGGR